MEFQDVSLNIIPHIIRYIIMVLCENHVILSFPNPLKRLWILEIGLYKKEC